MATLHRLLSGVSVAVAETGSCFKMPSNERSAAKSVCFFILKVDVVVSSPLSFTGGVTVQPSATNVSVRLDSGMALGIRWSCHAVNVSRTGTVIVSVLSER